MGLICLIQPLPAQAPPAEGVGRAPRILFLFSNDRLLPANVEVDRGFREVLNQRAQEPQLYSEFLDAVRFPDLKRQDDMELYLRERYTDHPPDLLVAGGPEAFKFLLDRRATLFPETPMVFVSVDMPNTIPTPLPPKITGISTALGITETLDMMLALRPQMKTIVVITGAAASDRAWEATCREKFAPYADRVVFQWWGAWPLDRIKQEISKLPPGTCVFQAQYFQGPDGVSHVPADVVEELSPISSVPMFGVYDTQLSRGLTGGSMVRFSDEGRAVATLALRVLADPEVANEPLQPPVKKQVILNFPELKRYGIEVDSLPKDAIILGREPSLWEAHRATMLWTSALVLVQSALIITLLLLRSRALRGEKQLRLSEERFSKAFQARPSAIAIIRTRDRIILDVNEVWCGQFGYRKGEVLGRSTEEMGLFVDDSDRERISGMMSGQRPVRGTEVVLKAKGGREIHARIYIEEITLADERCLIVVQHDITEQKRIDEQRMHLAHASRLITMGELTASIAHEVNQPLGAIICNVEAVEFLLSQEAPPLEEVSAIISDVREAVIRASEIMNRIRMLSRKQKLEAVELDVNQLLQDVIKVVEPDAHRRNISLITQLQAPLPTIMGDRVYLQQVILNLIMNGLESMAESPVKMRQLTLTTAGAERQVLISISDLGHGIPPDKMRHIFDSFFTTKAQGMGIGLAMAKSIVEMHGGELSAQNNEGPGATFLISLNQVERSTSL